VPKKNLQIPVFKAEHDDGLAKTIQLNASLSYITQLQDTKLSQEAARDFFRSAASDNTIDETQFDLFYLNTILVTTGCNKNFDVFTKVPTWSARYTPVHKHFNLEHDQSKIIGHMTSAKVVDEDFNPISDDISIEDLPDKFHILTGAVIYRALSDEKAQEAIETIISEINSGEWYVSMECLFRGFDYAVISETGEQRVIARDEETAWLTKHLRQYGGTGTYNGFTLGRVLNNITFSGKGLVRRPANPESIIFNQNVKAFHTSFANVGYITHNANNVNDGDINDNQNLINNLTKGCNKVMANTNDNDLNTTVKSLEKQVEDLTATNKNLAEQIKTYESSATTTKINDLETNLASKVATLAKVQGDLEKLVITNTELQGKLKAAETRAEVAEKEVTASKAAEKTRSRVDKLVKLGCTDSAEANTIVTSLVEKNDEEFEVLANLFAPKWKNTQTPSATAAVIPEPKVPTDALDSVVPDSDATLASTNQDVEKTRLQMIRVFAGLLNHDFDDTKDEE
jgi:hypothetical protein